MLLADMKWKAELVFLRALASKGVYCKVQLLPPVTVLRHVFS